MRLNPIAPSDDPLYESLYCFGGGGSDSGGGDSADDADSMDSGYDTSTVGMGTNTMGGGGDNDNGNDDPMGMADLAAEASKAQPSTNFSAANAALAGLDGGAGGSDSLIDSYLSGPMVADISTPMTAGSFVNPVTGQGIMQDIASGGLQSAMDAVAAAQGRGFAMPEGRAAIDAGYDQGSLLGQVGPTGEQFDYSTDDIFGSLTPEQLAVQEYVSGLKAGTPAADVVSQARSAALAPTPAEKQKPVGIETIKSPMDTPQSTQQERAAAAAAIAAGVLTADDIANRVAGGAGVSTRPGEKAGESVLTMDGKEYTFDNTLPGDQRVYSPVQAAGVTAARDVRPGAQQTLSPEAQAIVDESNRMGELLSQARKGVAGIQQTLSGIQGTIQGQQMGPYDPTEPEGGAAPVQSIIDEARANMQQSVASGTPTASTAAAANIDAETGLPVSVRQANAPTFGTVPNYDETDYLDLGTGQDLVSARKAAVEAGLAQAAKESPINTGIGIIDNVYNSIMAPNTMAKNMVVDQGGLVAYSTAPTQDIIGAVDPATGNIQPTRGNFFNTELNPVYDQYGRGPETGGDGGGDQTTMPQEVAPVAPKTCPDGYTYDAASDSCVYQAVSRVQPYQYTPSTRTPYAYTGLPTLAPTTLRPTFQARGQYAPLFPMNFGS